MMDTRFHLAHRLIVAEVITNIEAFSLPPWGPGEDAQDGKVCLFFFFFFFFLEGLSTTTSQTSFAQSCLLILPIDPMVWVYLLNRLK
jgi:hypothetical protein